MMLVDAPPTASRKREEEEEEADEERPGLIDVPLEPSGAMDGQHHHRHQLHQSSPTFTSTAAMGIYAVPTDITVPTDGNDGSSGGGGARWGATLLYLAHALRQHPLIAALEPLVLRGASREEYAYYGDELDEDSSQESVTRHIWSGTHTRRVRSIFVDNLIKGLDLIRVPRPPGDIESPESVAFARGNPLLGLWFELLCIDGQCTTGSVGGAGGNGSGPGIARGLGHRNAAAIGPWLPWLPEQAYDGAIYRLRMTAVRVCLHLIALATSINQGNYVASFNAMQPICLPGGSRAVFPIWELPILTDFLPGRSAAIPRLRPPYDPGTWRAFATCYAQLYTQASLLSDRIAEAETRSTAALSLTMSRFFRRGIARDAIHGLDAATVARAFGDMELGHGRGAADVKGSLPLPAGAAGKRVTFSPNTNPSDGEDDDLAVEGDDDDDGDPFYFDERAEIEESDGVIMGNGLLFDALSEATIDVLGRQMPLIPEVALRVARRTRAPGHLIDIGAPDFHQGGTAADQWQHRRRGRGPLPTLNQSMEAGRFVGDEDEDEDEDASTGEYDAHPGPWFPFTPTRDDDFVRPDTGPSLRASIEDITAKIWSAFSDPRDTIDPREQARIKRDFGLHYRRCAAVALGVLEPPAKDVVNDCVDERVGPGDIDPAEWEAVSRILCPPNLGA